MDWGKASAAFSMVAGVIVALLWVGSVVSQVKTNSLLAAVVTSQAADLDELKAWRGSLEAKAEARVEMTRDFCARKVFGKEYCIAQGYPR